MKTKLILLAALLGLASFANAASFRRDTIDARDSETWTLTLTAGVAADIVVEGDGDTDLDIFLYDGNGNLVDSDEDGTDFCVVGVTPRWTGTFTVVIVNHGTVYNEYDLSITP